MPAPILLIDDDRELCELVGRYLGAEGFHVEAAPTGQSGLARHEAGGFALVILDLMLPDLDGFEVLRRIRARAATPVLMLTAKGDLIDRVLGLEMGADDYLAKPFEPRELAARIRAVLRRARLADLPEARRGSLHSADLALDLGSRTAQLQGKPLALTTIEFDLLERFLRGAGQALTREQLMRDVLGREFSPFDRSIDTHVCNLRRKLGRRADGAERIKGVRGTGYLFAAPTRP